MKEIKIVRDDPKCLAAIDAALKAVNGRARSFAITDPKEVVRRAKNAYERFAGLPMSVKAGAEAEFTPSGPAAKAYRFGAASTYLRFRIGGNGKTIFLKDVRGITVYPRDSAETHVYLRPKAHAEYLARRAKDFGILDEKVDAVEGARESREMAALQRLADDLACLDGMAA